MHHAEGAAVIKHRQDPPVWFTVERYARLCTLGLAEWQYEIQRCHWLKNVAEPGQWSERPAVQSFIGAPIVQLVPKGDLTLHRLEKPALIVQLDAPEGVLLRKVKEALKLAREKYPAPVRKPGPKTLNAEFTHKQIATWLNYKIVPLCELDNWRKELQKKDCAIPTDADFGRWIFSERADPSKEIVTARKVLEKAIANIPALWAQVEGTTSEFVTGN
jgi:hypothetical protein